MIRGTPRQLLGVLGRDLPTYARGLLGGPDAYLRIRNRNEKLEPAPDGSGFRCDWQWTSTLHAPQVVPALGRALLSAALKQHAFCYADAIENTGAPQVTFLIGHRGEERTPLLMATLRSVAAQRGARVECVVVEQDDEPRLAGRLPPWVRHIHTPPPKPGMPYCRSWAFNVGANAARAPLLVLHDNDILVPVDYARQALDCAARGFDAMNLKRFIFYLAQAESAAAANNASALRDIPVCVVVQNLEAGGSMAISRDAYERIGGMDEGFVGWGGEDNELWERVQTLRVWPWARLPFIHLWHAAQPGKAEGAPETSRLYRELSRIDPRQRIEVLRSVPRGLADGPHAPGTRGAV